MKRSERVSAIVKILSDSPNQSYSLGTFCQMFGAAKSSISEDHGGHYRGVAIYMLPEHAKAWGGRIAACREDAHSE